METLLYFLLAGALVFVMMRFGCGAHVGGHGHGRRHEPAGGGAAGDRLTPPAQDVDPVCGMNVATATAKSVLHQGRAYFFCSPACRDQFEAAPEKFAAHKPRFLPMEHRHG